MLTFAGLQKGSRGSAAAAAAITDVAAGAGA
jgi:hypothetical protein